ncbi:MAG: hypothetical protein ACM3VT_15750 [Solirubrobacterales bacterium]
MTKRTWMVSGIVAVLTVAAAAQDFFEGWESTQTGDYSPATTPYLSGDAGSWFLADTITQSTDCDGTSRNQAQILVQGGSRVLRLLSNRSFTKCEDDIWVLLSEFDTFNQEFGIPLNANTILSFDERGELEDPQLHNGGVDCLLPPCFDNVSLVLTDNNGNILAYVLQRYPAAVENTPNTHYGDTYREIFLDPDAGTYRRNVYNDFQRIRTFEPKGAKIVSIEFRVDQHGWAIIDNIAITMSGPDGSVPVYRFWSPVLFNHFYTASESERQMLVNDYPDIWTSEGVGFYARPEAGDTNASPVYRFYSPVYFSHFYTIDPAERDMLLRDYPFFWVEEGIAFYAYTENTRPADTVPVYRFWSPVLNDHFYTASETEADTLTRNYPTIWTFEGVAWYAWRP